MACVIEEILAEEDALFDLEDVATTETGNHTAASGMSGKLPKVTLKMVEDVCLSLAENCVSKSTRPVYRTMSWAAVLKSVEFMNQCLVPRTKFMHSCKEQAWKRYASAYFQNMDKVTAVTGSHPTSGRLCLRLFQKLLDESYPFDKDVRVKASKCAELSAETKDVVNYIGGSIITKLRQKTGRVKDPVKKEAMLECLSEFCGEGQSSGDSQLTTTLNRGGLVFLKPSAQTFFQLLEVRVQEVCSGEYVKANCTLSQFQEKCEDDETVTAAYHVATYGCECAGVTEIMFGKVVQLYFKIRVHHECRMFMERQKGQNRILKHGMRKNIKANVSDIPVVNK